MQARAHRPALVAPTALSIAAWLSFLVLEQSRYGRLIGHAAGHGSAAGHAGAQDSGPLLFFTAGWALMVVAMMAPAVLPFVMQLSASMAPIGHRARPVVLLLGGYVAAWTAFGVAAHVALQVFVQAAGLAPGASRMIGPVALIVAGVYQLTPLKRRLVRRSCSPPPVVPHGRASRWWPRTVLLGVREGAVCIGCFWALMLLRLAGVAGSGGGMLALGSVMWVEKNTTWGRRLAVPMGLFLIGLGLVLGWGPALRTLPMHEHAM